MKIKNPAKCAASLRDDVKFITSKLSKLSYLIPNEANDLIDVLTELRNYTESICSVLLSKENKVNNTDGGN